MEVVGLELLSALLDLQSLQAAQVCSLNLFLITVDIDDCAANNNQQCNGMLHATCTDAGANARTCTCQIGFAGTATLDGTDPFAGCTGIK